MNDQWDDKAREIAAGYRDICPAMISLSYAVSSQRKISALAREAQAAGQAAAQAWPPLNETLAEILGRPNFACGELAHCFRLGGATIAYKAEAEQAFVIHWLVGLYLKHGADYRKTARGELQALHDRLEVPFVPPPPEPQG